MDRRRKEREEGKLMTTYEFLESLNIGNVKQFVYPEILREEHRICIVPDCKNVVNWFCGKDKNNKPIFLCFGHGEEF